VGDVIEGREFGFKVVPPLDSKGVWMPRIWLKRMARGQVRASLQELGLAAKGCVGLSTWRLALALLGRAYHHYNFPMDDESLSRVRLSRRQATGALRHLERLGLVRVEWSKWNPPLVTPLFVAVQLAPRKRSSRGRV
jgi:hypothetical protein